MLFLLGGLVRATGSGMGCPDWPKCFGLLAPPTCDCQLPPNYREVFLEKRLAKVERLAAMLDKFGFAEKAAQLRNDESILIPESFNVSKAWIEYINRIFGMITGLFGFWFFISALFGKHSGMVRLLVILGFFMLLLNAWLGSIVVATNLLPGVVTSHFMLSFLCIFLFMGALHFETNFAVKGASKSAVGMWLVLFVGVMLVVVLGTFAREHVAVLTEKNQLTNQEKILNYEAMGMDFFLHRYIPGGLLVLSMIFGWMRRKKNGSKFNGFFIVSTLFLLQIAAGAINIVYVLPPASQVVHIVIGSLIPVICFYHLLANQNTIFAPAKLQTNEGII